MHVCMYACMYVCMHVYMYICMYMYTYKCVLSFRVCIPIYIERERGHAGFLPSK